MMRNVQEYINSGIIEEYCLGILPPDKMAEVARLAREYPEIDYEIDRTIQALMAYEANESALDPDLKYHILDTVSQLSDASVFDINNLPLINIHSDVAQWQRTLAPIQPTRDYRNLYAHTLRDDEQVVQQLVWVKFEVRPETHHDEQESFLILEGECECTISEEAIRLAAGGYVEIPRDVEHNVQVLSAHPVKAIVQRLKLTA